ncbi:family 1 glycosylhydrolase [Falsiroseomonas tokyonensis]|uniref:Family 1 glycosylhydrolase n=1 Tax=Falsiroseomonas tokyonensis TaxID=430521 RepID=A0ABV7BQP9_9PROT|nr:family 1 glycosylhydrolase [Falsiroseomonas tokyonensis]MBU8537972.1 family 1 glycosylhydrolase [Falsiroseomonas tokyonensis]
MLDAPMPQNQVGSNVAASQHGFLFATGIENSAPTIQGGRLRRDQMRECGHYERWREDFALVRELGCDALRYGPQLHSTLRAPGLHDWSFADEAFAEIRRLGIRPIVDLCHFGVPDWIGDFQNPDFPALFAEYAGAFAQRFPWVQLYTPVNEMFITAVFSARYGWWNEQRADDRSYVTAIKHVVRANVLAMREILKHRPDAIFIQSESTEAFHPECPASVPHADFRNAERFLTLDLNYGRRVDSTMYEFLLDNGMTRAEYHFFLDNRLKRHCVMGNDWYQTNEHLLNAEGHGRWAGEVFGYDTVTRDYHARYGLPVMHTETNLDEGPNGDEAERWLWKQWSGILRLRREGIPVLGFTWYSLTDQIDWTSALREPAGVVNPRGLYDLDRKPRRVGLAYKRLIESWREVLPTQSLCLQVPLSAA